MSKKGYMYSCPNAGSCKLHKRCHVLTTVNKLETPIMVRQICPAQGRNVEGRKIEIVIKIG